ncbi:MAG TPA: hypothetical protein DCW52_04580 [Gammaproteobacteria bacterium]|jgi:hypothetical protein|nr:hypothetical protein [Gammaproteobacteria bacterium]
MTDEIVTANSDADQTSVESTNMSVEDFALRRLGEPPQKPQDEPEAVEPETEEEEEQIEEVELPEEIEEEAPEESVLSKLDLDDMSEEDLRELADKLGSRAVARFGELTAKRKSAEEQLAAMQAKQKEQVNPLESSKKVDNNPFGNLETIEKLQEKSSEIEGIVEWAEDVLFESDSYAADDVVTEINGKDMTKADVRKALLQARKAQKVFLPDQLKSVQAQNQAEELTAVFGKQAKEELPWLEGEDNDLRKQYEATIGDKRFSNLKRVLKKEAPEVAAQLDYWFAHATNSIYGRKPVEVKTSSPKLKPPRNGMPSSAKSEKPTTKTAKALKELESRFKKTGNPNDFAALRKAKMTLR